MEIVTEKTVIDVKEYIYVCVSKKFGISILKHFELLGVQDSYHRYKFVNINGRDFFATLSPLEEERVRSEDRDYSEQIGYFENPKNAIDCFRKISGGVIFECENLKELIEVIYNMRYLVDLRN